MYKLVVVDDEKLVRNGIKTCIDWNNYRIEFAGEATDAEEALLLIEDVKPDIVITDICMGEMDGLELTARVREVVPGAKVIILSGYDDFDFAQKAVRNKAFDYILKPVDAGVLVKILEKAIAVIEDEKSKLEDVKLLRKRFKESIPIIKGKCMDNILTTHTTLNKIKDMYPYIDFKIKDEPIVVMAIRLDEPDVGENREAHQMKLLAIKQMVNDIISSEYNGEIVEVHSNIIAVILNYMRGSDEQQLVDSLYDLGMTISAKIRGIYKLRVSIGVGRFYDDSSAIHKSFKEAVEALDNSILLESGQVLFYRDVMIEPKNYYLLYPFAEEGTIISNMKMGDVDTVKVAVIQFVEYFSRNNISTDMLKNAALQLFYEILRKLAEWNIPQDIFADYREPLPTRIKNEDSSTEIEKLLKGFTSYVTMYINERKNSDNNLAIEKACRFMKDNITADINLNDIASSVYLTPNYFAFLFKKETGLTVMEYFTKLRMEKAVKLLMDERVKIYEAANLVGYNDVRYFVKIFKKYYGKTPSEYRLSNIASQ